jgi:hypothetical protein
MSKQKLQNPTDRYPKPPYKKQSQPWPGLVAAAEPLFAKAGIAEGDHDEGVIQLTSSKDVAEFVGELGKLRVWGREPNVKMK